MNKTFTIHPDARARQEMLDGAKSRAYENEESAGSPATIDQKQDAAPTCADDSDKGSRSPR